jgi:hypothetical protein
MEEVMTHTPGPWNTMTVNPYRIAAYRTDSDNVELAYVKSENISDARLIAAAPELLEALQALQPILWNDGPLVAAYKDVEAKVDAAIAKATGEQS